MRRSALFALLIALLILLGGWFAYGELFKKADPKEPVLTQPTLKVDAGPPPAAAPVIDAGTGAADAGPEAPLRALVISVRGLVQTRSADDPNWAEANEGQELSADDSVRTGRNAEAKLRVGNGVEVRLSPRSEFSIRELTEGVSRVRLEQGRVSASVDDNGDRVLRVEARGSDAVAETRGGRFGMVTDGKGQVAVATETGSVKLTSAGASVKVEAGTQSTVVQNQAPSAPTAVPKSLFLKVAPPPKTTTNQRRHVVSGTTAPGALVRAGDKVAVADARGKFRVPVTLQDGANRIVVDVTDPSGRETQQRLPKVVVDRKKPGIDAEMKWGDEIVEGGEGGE
jgi:hypothetical protein